MTAYEEAMSKLVDRVGTLESRAHGVMDRLREFDGYVERLEALERGDLLVVARDGESKRRDRWYATRDTMLAKFAMHNCDNPLSFESHFKQAEAYADRAHGPLESKK